MDDDRLARLWFEHRLLRARAGGADSDCHVVLLAYIYPRRLGDRWSRRQDLVCLRRDRHRLAGSAWRPTWFLKADTPKGDPYLGGVSSFRRFKRQGKPRPRRVVDPTNGRQGSTARTQLRHHVLLLPKRHCRELFEYLQANVIPDRLHGDYIRVVLI